ncbi:hypothetical protein ACR9YC_02925 [Parasphingorhabdus sp. DH2-15]|uniref:hypothetical protein n=1 Tax=Parasphingorhabdus sp. DH2-15 TaxID=3444112 RepID=UPI003F68915D
MLREIAILVDGGFFTKKLSHLVGKNIALTPQDIAYKVRDLCCNHVYTLTDCDPKKWHKHVYRIFITMHTLSLVKPIILLRTNQSILGKVKGLRSSMKFLIV